MPRFNTPTASATQTTNLAGGTAFKESAKLEFASILLTSMVADSYYRSEAAGLARMTELLDAVPPLFAAKTAVYARQQAGMRSISHVVAGEIAHRVRGERWTRAFFDAVVRRPDDITEILSYYIARHGRRPLPNALRDGLARAFGKFDSYQLAKYRAEGKAMSLVDAVNITHPHPNERNGDALRALVAGTLRSQDTWEARLSEAGKEESEEEQADAKNAAWGDLIATRKLGYFALLRNLRNIMQQAPEALPAALEMLQDPKQIRRSLVLPFRFITAAQEIEQLPGSRDALLALANACDLSLLNVPRFEGNTLVVVDVSGSMAMGNVGRGKTKVADVAALFGAALYARNQADLMLFAESANYVNLAPNAGLLSLTDDLRGRMQGGGTNFQAIFDAATLAYDRVVILSDMQGWMGRMGHDAPTAQFQAYVHRVGKYPKVYSFDLAGYGTLQLPEREVYCLAGFSDRVFEVMALLDQDRSALVRTIEAVEFN